MMKISADAYEVLTFDCYGTLIDWERGILAALKPVLAIHNVQCADSRLLELYAKLEAREEKKAFTSYREVLGNVVRGIGTELGYVPSTPEVGCLANSIKNWKPFPDTVDALRRLKARYRLGIISNVDDDLFAGSAKHLKVEFDYVITAEQVRSYKPSANNFQSALRKFRVPPKKVLHVACSLYHDVVTAKALGFATVWVNRRNDALAANTPANRRPDLEVPDLKTLASVLMG